MFIFLSKILPPFVYPLGLGIGLLILALIICKHPRLQKGLILAAIVLIWSFSIRWTSISLARSLEWRYLPQKDIPSADVIVVLGGSTEPALFPRSYVEVNSAGDRVLYAARLYKQGKAPTLLLSGGYITWLGDRASTPAAEMADILNLMDVSNDHLLLQTQSRNTYEDALFTHNLLKEKGINRIILVTSAMHMPRAVALFEHQGFEVIPAPTDYTVTETEWESLFHGDIGAKLMALIPSSGNLNLSTNVLKEYLGMFIYHLRGWM